MKLKDWHKGLIVGLCALIISTLGIQASDELQGISSRFLSGAVENSRSVCEAGTVLIVVEGQSLCLDAYEAGVGTGCVFKDPQSEQETLVNLAEAKCFPESKSNVLPWRFVTYTQAQQLCARSGKRLPTNNEWYKSALALSNPEDCLVANSLATTGVNNCVTTNGVFDLVGNVWEWVEDTVTDGKYNDRALPDSGYVSLVDSAGVVLESKVEPDPAFASDYAWINKEGTRGILRGGFYGSAGDGGIFAQNLSVPLNFAATGVGFRCIRDLM